ncbi:hypothetical protein [Cupriavidus sp. AcVe19-6a]|uniref:hypothetical protein n=1 Tax=Cupriavidus sp. AcVe19-6a TaxID=2821358 RepID=UPI001AE8AB80|nr:hypothetical protein [Cupriavidus sp. AcVe19-6a]MBP0639104.1 hypothetical protein [Cupriavidus sp. AcVe19-6a]
MDETVQPALQALKDEVLLKVGRNLLHNQEIEHLLKSILGIARIEGSLADAGSRLEARQENLRTSSMGVLLKRFRDEFLTCQSESADDERATEADLPWIKTTVQIELSAEDRATLEAELAALARERNDLAHHFLPHWQPESLARMAETSARLDRQHERIAAMKNRLKSMRETTMQACLSYADFLKSSEFREAFELVWLQGSRMMGLLREIAATPHREDGWTDFSYAQAIARAKEPDAFADRKARYGEQSLKALVIKSQLFDVAEETLLGGVRTLIRIRQKRPC